jgi:hypothetical protein
LQLSLHSLDDRDSVKERVASRLERLEAAAGRRMLKGTGVPATIGATAPFVGLFLAIDRSYRVLVADTSAAALRMVSPELGRR